LFKTDNEFKENLITSLLNGDGYIGDKATNPSIEISLSNKKLLRDVKLWLLELGVISNFDNFVRTGKIKVREEKEIEYTMDVERLRITQKDSFDIIINLLNKNHQFNKFNNSNKKSFSSNVKTELNNNMYLMKIKNIEKQDFCGEVFNISVEDDESYCTENFMVHNCLPLFRSR
jgi:intein/homing endonuclease